MRHDNALDIVAVSIPNIIIAGTIDIVFMMKGSVVSNSGVAEYANLITRSMYTVMVIRILPNVPRTSAFRGSANSPDIPTPASIPVTAGKNNANAIQNGMLPNPVKFASIAPGTTGARNMVMSDNTITVSIAYCIFMTNCAPLNVIAKNSNIKNIARYFSGKNKPMLWSNTFAILVNAIV